MRHGHILFFALVTIMSGCTEINRAKTYLLPPTALAMEEFAPKVFVNKEMSLVQREEFSRTVTESRKKVTDFYGGIISEPQIFACSTEECFVGVGGGRQR